LTFDRLTPKAYHCVILCKTNTITKSADFVVGLHMFYTAFARHAIFLSRDVDFDL